MCSESDNIDNLAESFNFQGQNIVNLESQQGELLSFLSFARSSQSSEVPLAQLEGLEPSNQSECEKQILSLNPEQQQIIILSQENPETEENQLKNILSSWNLDHLYERFQELGIDFECLKFIDVADITKIVGNSEAAYGTFIKLKGHIRRWRKEQGLHEPIGDDTADADTLSANTKVTSWISKSDYSSAGSPLIDN